MTVIGAHLVRISPSGNPVSLAHRIESEIAERVVTHCGRQMPWKTRAGRLMTAITMDRDCSECPPRLTPPVDNDAVPADAPAYADDEYNGRIPWR